MRVSEIFGPTIQGEGPLIGRPTVFVRFGGCDFRCSWCDSMYAVDPKYRNEWVSMDAEEIVVRVRGLSPEPTLVTLSGGNPAIQPVYEMKSLLETFRLLGYETTMETQGSVSRAWFRELDYVVISPKPPSSGMHCDHEMFTRVIESSPAYRTFIKVVVVDDDDFEFLCEIYDKYNHVPIFAQVANLSLGDGVDLDQQRRELLYSLTWLTDKVLESGLNITVLPQLHVLMYGNRRAV